MRDRLAIVTILTALAVPVQAQDGGSGLKPDSFLPGPFHSFVATGEHAGRLHCLVCANGLNPTVMIFTRDVPEAGKPMGELLKQIDAMIAKYPGVKTGAFVVVLSEDVGDGEKYDKRTALAGKAADAAKALGLSRVVLALDTATGPKTYNLDPANQDVIVFYHKHKVLANYTYGADKLPGGDVAKIVKEVEKTIAEIDRLVRPQRPSKRGGN